MNLPCKEAEKVALEREIFKDPCETTGAENCETERSCRTKEPEKPTCTGTANAVTLAVTDNRPSTITCEDGYNGMVLSIKELVDETRKEALT